MESVEYPFKVTAKLDELGEVTRRYFCYEALAIGRQQEENTPSVVSIKLALDIALSGEPVYQAHGAVVLDQQDLGQFSDSHPPAMVDSLYCQERLIGLGTESRGFSRCF